ncbi:hypothetical protein [Amycolatopsis sp. M39]|uniref:hypothetical protein n=1 Tax=Amycolatopsis sp. M39 TaxID=1825094 RepID=UPI000829C658
MEVQVEGIEFLGFRTDAHLLHRAADVVFTTGGSTALELVRNAIPAVAFSSSTRSIGWKRSHKLAHWSVLSHSEGLDPDPPAN